MPTSNRLMPVAGSLCDGPPPRTDGVLILAYYFPPLNESGAHRPFRFARHLEPLGFKPYVITASDPGSQSPWPASTYVQDPQVHPSERTNAETRMAALVQRVLPYNDRIEWTPSAIHAAETVIRQNPTTAVVSTSPPLATHFAALTLKRRYKLRWIADIRDPISQNPFRSGVVANFYDAMVERTVVRHADAVLANTDASAEALKQRFPKYAHKIHVVWNGYDPHNRLEPSPLPKHDCKVLLHAGSLYGGRHPGAIIRSMDRLISRGLLTRSAVQLCLIGGVDRDHRWIAESGFDRLLSEPWLECIDRMLPVREAHRRMASAEGLLLLDMNSKGASLQVPGKLFEYVQIGRPILAITNPGSPTERILSRSGVPHVCLYQTASDDEVDRALLEFFSLPTDPVTPSAWFYDQFDAARQSQFLATLLRS